MHSLVVAATFKDTITLGSAAVAALVIVLGAIIGLAWKNIATVRREELVQCREQRDQAKDDFTKEHGLRLAAEARTDITDHQQKMIANNAALAAQGREQMQAFEGRMNQQLGAIAEGVKDLHIINERELVILERTSEVLAATERTQRDQLDVLRDIKRGMQ